jgi:class 3 adenylate cyclase
MAVSNTGADDKPVELDISSRMALKKMPVDIFNGIYVGEVKTDALTLCIDIRRFSKFLRDNDETTVFTLIKEFSSNFLSCVNQFGYNCSYYKLIGDGAIVIWDTSTDGNVTEALMVFDTFTDFTDEYLFKAFPDLGLAGALVMEKVFKYEISAESSGLKYRDYVGYGINLACRLQTLAKKGELILNSRLAQDGRIPHEARKSKQTHMQFLKGMREEDRAALYLYKRPNP